MGVPSTNASPAVGRIMPSAILIVVVLPAPFAAEKRRNAAPPDRQIQFANGVHVAI